MRWITDAAKFPKDGDKRVIIKFCLLPKKLKSEVVWLEKAKILQEYSSNYADDGWKDIHFVI